MGSPGRTLLFLNPVETDTRIYERGSKREICPWCKPGDGAFCLYLIRARRAVVLFESAARVPLEIRIKAFVKEETIPLLKKTASRLSGWPLVGGGTGTAGAVVKFQRPADSVGKGRTL